MILRPLRPPAASSEIVPAWNAVAATQQQDSSAWWLIAQPDHAALAGSLAAHFTPRDFPVLDREAVRAISLHDSGWAAFDGGGEAGGGKGAAPPPPRNSAGRPLSFLDASVAVFIQAWTASIDCAEARAGSVGGLIVSGHFRRLAENRLNTAGDLPEDAASIHAFLENQRQRDEARFRRQPRSSADVERLIDVLQFCDLLSLYLCCGSLASVQFQQLIGTRPTVLRREGALCVLEPSPFHEPVSLGVPARREPVSRDEPNARDLPVLIR